MTGKLLNIEQAVASFRKLLEQQQQRSAQIKSGSRLPDFATLPCVRIALAGGDGIGPVITQYAQRVLEYLLKDEIAQGKAELTEITGLTLENRLAQNCSVPETTLRQIKSCHVLLKGPTTTPQAGQGIANLESANVTLRRELDLYANVRPVNVPDKGIDWCFFRENTEGAYVLGSQGVLLEGREAGSELAFDFAVTTRPGVERIARSAMNYAKNNGKKRVSIVTKANIIKTGDGNFLQICKEIAGREFPELEIDDWYIDIMAANLVNEDLRRKFQVFILPNLYGDILTDEAAEIQGGLGTAGSANIGDRYAMFEPVHGSAPRLIEEGRLAYVDPRSVLRACSMMLAHIGRGDKGNILDRAVTAASTLHPITGFENGAKTEDFIAELMKGITRAFGSAQAP
ncbi:isocitrate/isopropylmalate family dehydrogenase [Candidatus Haliotispira prima]|uniref:Isocitrate/isopropylmalate family dehydrogenase n=1 Tax=Candidatus Haliotispira prima TaxID=3034016 RepID=A0ABY8MI41_9SPIO|nr:isocitrate/isopropylmalate family dehydrogenase [Candidatus Haliotispira prima]